MADIVLCTVNARYQHAAFGLRCLRANLGELRERSELVEFDGSIGPSEVVEQLLARRPRIIGLGVYVWNVAIMSEVVELLAKLAPEVVTVLGGPEVSHELEAQPWTERAHAVVQGEGEWHFRALCDEVLAGRPLPRRIFPAQRGALDRLALPYDEYTDDDLAHRVLYVEASRGCPYSCEFCLSALDERVRPFSLDRLLEALKRLLDRGARHFKFVDRTFNLDLEASVRLLEFFLAEWRPGCFLHFEMVPDRFPPVLREVVARFPRGTLQLEVGIQTFDSEVSKRISRPLDVGKVEDNLRFLVAAGVHVHADLIAGLPGESLEQFARGFDRLLALGPAEIQVGVLKRLRGAPISRHTDPLGMLYATRAPYEVLRTSAIGFPELQHLKRFATLWEAVGNSGNFARTLPLLVEGPSAFAAFSALVRRVTEREGRAHRLSLLGLMEHVLDHLVERGVAEELVRERLLADYRAGGRHEVPGFLRGGSKPSRAARFDARQRRHSDREP